ncbi:MAG: tetratricopeptide repeat protein, partial [Acidobacteria bacterium]|nr:tetratricopeptide repeat protein [Acidobacteriota bacterium]
IQALIEGERGDTEKALGTAIQSNRIARGYEVPAAVLTELAWGLLEESPSAAERGFLEALRVRPDDPNVLTGLGNVYLTLRRPEEAAKMFQRALAISPDWSEAAEGLELVRRMKGTS